ncbi:MAG TPA: hypothetical protein VE591_15625 [Candidatus Acidoferrum sp.]|nr:hypothetical protein [Candidatus Acidoferrum sp.]
MKRLLLTLALVASTATAASAQVTGPLSPPPAQRGTTSRLLFDAALATARAAASNPTAAQQARVNYQAAIEQFNERNFAAARGSAMQAINAAGAAPVASPIQPMKPYTAPYVPQSVVVPGTIASINADAFVAAARSSVNACMAAKSPNAKLAQQRLASAERDNAAGQYGSVVAEAQSVVDLCAPAQSSMP